MRPNENGIDALIARLTAPLPPDHGWIERCVDGLAKLQAPLESVSGYLNGLPEHELVARFDGSHDTSTHYKWLIYRSHSPRFTLWLHEYKNAGSRRLGYAEVPHDHRYDIVSLIMSGGYTAATWETRDDAVVQGTTTSFKAQSVMHLSHDLIHSLIELDDGTLTLVIEGPRRKGYSTACYPDGTRRTFPDFATRWPELQDKLN